MKKWRITLWSWVKGIVFGAGTGAAMAVQQGLDGGRVSGKAVGMAAVGGALVYLLKKLGTDEVKEATKVINKAGGEVIDPNTRLPFK